MCIFKCFKCSFLGETVLYVNRVILEVNLKLSTVLPASTDVICKQWYWQLWWMLVSCSCAWQQSKMSLAALCNHCWNTLHDWLLLQCPTYTTLFTSDCFVFSTRTNMKIIHFIPVSVEFITEFGHNKSHEIYSHRLTAYSQCSPIE